MARLAAKTGFLLTPMTLKTCCLVIKQTPQTFDWSQETFFFINKNANYVKCHTKIEGVRISQQCCITRYISISTMTIFMQS